jgi:hypothetical protein
MTYSSHRGRGHSSAEMVHASELPDGLSGLHRHCQRERITGHLRRGDCHREVIRSLRSNGRNSHQRFQVSKYFSMSLSSLLKPI